MARIVDEIKNPELFSLRADDGVEDALGYLMALDISGAPIVDADKKPVGVVSMRDLMKRGAPSVGACIHSPVISVNGKSLIEDAARQLAAHNVHRLVVVDDAGRATGVVSTLDVLRGMLGLPARHPDAFPHYDVETGLTWTNDIVLDFDNLDNAPDTPGIFVLRTGGIHMLERDVWLEAANNVRTRLYELLSIPQTDGLLGRMLEQHRSSLRYRAASIPDATKRDQALGVLRERLVSSRLGLGSTR